MRPVHHAPANYRCPFCRFARNEFDELNAEGDLVARTDAVVARVSPKWWPNNPGHVIVSPVEHFENLYELPQAVGQALFDSIQKVAIAMRETYCCDGISTRQHNEPAGGQDVWHHHVHVFPRYHGDDLYLRHDESVYVPVEDRARYGSLLREFLKEE
ncbi:HIT family protein [Rhodococcoides kyotonense]|uniref:Histidine triad (HIT) family protein n=1 Tax=Rhodococcoides kyotonense TaxID=398843 RepID=A0A239MEI3_9NOCA|nr:HIT family protein [Rhodococcus kyotonensis]SNT41086.1 histidine triad (HIT) family protein [Rhodococcus kyotonensis]